VTYMSSFERSQAVIPKQQSSFSSSLIPNDGLFLLSILPILLARMLLRPSPNRFRALLWLPPVTWLTTFKA
jgi:hypothetical protein